MIFAIDDEVRKTRTALVDGDTSERWTWLRLSEEVNRCRQALNFAGKALIFHFCRNTPVAVAWYLGAIEAGHAVALLSEKLDVEARSALLSAFHPEFVLCPECPGEGYKAHPQAGLWSAADIADWPPIHSDLALLLSTSGSTGSPKMARLTRGNIAANAASIAEALDLTEEDRPVVHLPIHYSYGLSVVNSHLLAGATSVMTNGSVIAADFWKSVAKERCSSFSGVPYTYQILQRMGFDRLTPAQSILSMTQAGGKLDDKTIEQFRAIMSARNGRFWVMYGQTEATARMSVLPAARLADKTGSAGCAIPGGTFAIATEDGLSTLPGVTGELVYRGPNVMLGYAFNRADLAKGDELGGLLHTGDRAQLDAEGYVFILGRSKRDAKVFGLRINMDDVEAMLRLHGPVAVVNGADKLIIYCEFGEPAELRKLHAELSARLSLHGSALDFRAIGKLPTGNTGKIDYSRLMDS
jgi:acyl-coenzyme A synthetase/AMP-(fatty) acid ligase